MFGTLLCALGPSLGMFYARSARRLFLNSLRVQPCGDRRCSSQVERRAGKHIVLTNDAPVDILSSTLDLILSVKITFSGVVRLSLLSALAPPLDSSIPEAHAPCYGSPEAVQIGFYGEHVFFGGGSSRCMRSMNGNHCTRHFF